MDCMRLFVANDVKLVLTGFGCISVGMEIRLALKGVCDTGGVNGVAVCLRAVGDSITVLLGILKSFKSKLNYLNGSYET